MHKAVSLMGEETKVREFNSPLISGINMNSLKASLSILLTLGVTVTPLSPSVTAVAREAKPSVVEQLARIFRPTPRPSRSRGGGCLVTPGEPLWSDIPLFVWEFNVGKIEVRTANDRRSVWSQALTPNNQSAIYQGEPLQPGQTYEVILYDVKGERVIRNADFYPRFTLIEEAKRQQIQAGLTQIEKQLRSKKASVEAIALEKAIYFSEQALWSDALQVIYLVPNPSAELRQFVQQATQDACKDSDTTVTL